MPEPTFASVDLAKSMLEQDDNPLTLYVALIIGRVMSLNHAGLTDIFDAHRAEFEARGAGDLLRKLEADAGELLSGFLNVGDE